MTEPFEVGSITITYEMNADGDLLTGVSVDGDLPLATQLGMLRLAEETILSVDEYEDGHE